MKLRDQYNKNKEAKIGETCICPSCKTSFTKQSYQQVFCKSKQGTKCKDKYWNTVTPEKRNNTTRISPANAKYMALNSRQRTIDRQDRLTIELEYDGEWDGHNCYVGRCEWCECLICRCID